MSKPLTVEASSDGRLTVSLFTELLTVRTYFKGLRVSRTCACAAWCLCCVGVACGLRSGPCWGSGMPGVWGTRAVQQQYGVCVRVLCVLAVHVHAGFVPVGAAAGAGAPASAVFGAGGATGDAPISETVRVDSRRLSKVLGSCGGVLGKTNVCTCSMQRHFPALMDAFGRSLACTCA
jgi:hypothetical protein